MTTVYEEVMDIGNLELEKIKYPTVKKSSDKEVDELLGDLNPRYFEEIISLKEARQKVYSSHFSVSGNYNLFNSY